MKGLGLSNTRACVIYINVDAVIINSCESGYFPLKIRTPSRRENRLNRISRYWRARCIFHNLLARKTFLTRNNISDEKHEHSSPHYLFSSITYYIFYESTLVSPFFFFLVIILKEKPLSPFIFIFQIKPKKMSINFSKIVTLLTYYLFYSFLSNSNYLILDSVLINSDIMRIKNW